MLGFSEKVNNTIDNEGNEIHKETEFIYNLFDDAQELLNRTFDYKTNNSRVFNHFSDTIVISCLETEEGGVFSLFTDVIFLLLASLKRNTLLRGSVVCDWLCHEEGKIFGPALIKAYNVENNIAIYPRIVFDEEIFAIAEMYPAKWIKKSDRNNISKYLITKDFDGLYYFDYKKIINYFSSDKYENIYSKILIKLIIELAGAKDSKKISKYLWLKEKYL